MEYKTGTLVEFRSRPWVVQQSSDKDILIIKPLGGTDAEVIGLYKPLYKDQLNSMVCSYDFRKPSSDDVGANSYPEAARILYNACRLSFRDIAGPFHCLGRISFGSPDKPGGLSIQLCKSEKKEFYIRYSS